MGYDSTGTRKGFLYSGGVYTDIIPPGWSNAVALGINDVGAVVGVGQDSTGTRKGFLYSGGSNGTYTELLPPGWSNAEALGINNSGAVVGDGQDSNLVSKGFIAEPVQAPTVVTLAGFKAKAGKGQVVITWLTESEIDNAGFNLYRSSTEDGEYIKIDTALIPAKGSSTQGANYEFIDNDVKNRKIYYYKLEDIDLNGTSTMHGPVSATPRWIFSVLGK